MSTHSFRIINTTNDSQQIPVLRCLLNAETLLDLPVGNQAYEATDFLDDYRQIWTRVMRGFLATAGVGDYLVFAPEILPGALTTPANSVPATCSLANKARKLPNPLVLDSGTRRRSYSSFATSATMAGSSVESVITGLV